MTASVLAAADRDHASAGHRRERVRARADGITAVGVLRRRWVSALLHRGTVREIDDRTRVDRHADVELEVGAIEAPVAHDRAVHRFERGSGRDEAAAWA